MFFLSAGITVAYFPGAAFFLPETKGKKLEEIEVHLEGRAAVQRVCRVGGGDLFNDGIFD